MTIILHNGQHALQLALHDWNQMLALGRRHGWRPAGTQSPDWDDPAMQAAYADPYALYTRVTPADAQALADALKAALSDVSENDGPGGPRSRPVRWAPLDGMRSGAERKGSSPAGPDPQLVSASAGDAAQRIERFVSFATQGGFSVSWSARS
jgi:hypothetical protein